MVISGMYPNVTAVETVPETVLEPAPAVPHAVQLVAPPIDGGLSSSKRAESLAAKVSMSGGGATANVIGRVVQFTGVRTRH